MNVFPAVLTALLALCPLPSASLAVPPAQFLEWDVRYLGDNLAAPIEGILVFSANPRGRSPGGVEWSDYIERFEVRTKPGAILVDGDLQFDRQRATITWVSAAPLKPHSEYRVTWWLRPFVASGPPDSTAPATKVFDQVVMTPRDAWPPATPPTMEGWRLEATCADGYCCSASVLLDVAPGMPSDDVTVRFLEGGPGSTVATAHAFGPGFQARSQFRYDTFAPGKERCFELMGVSAINGSTAIDTRCVEEPADLALDAIHMACVEQPDGRIAVRHWAVWPPPSVTSLDALFTLEVRRQELGGTWHVGLEVPPASMTVVAADARTGASVPGNTYYDDEAAWLVWRSDSELPSGTLLEVTVDLDEPIPDALDYHNTFSLLATDSFDPSAPLRPPNEIDFDFVCSDGCCRPRVTLSGRMSLNAKETLRADVSADSADFAALDQATYPPSETLAGSLLNEVQARRYQFVARLDDFGAREVCVGLTRDNATTGEVGEVRQCFSSPYAALGATLPQPSCMPSNIEGPGVTASDDGGCSSGGSLPSHFGWLILGLLAWATSRTRPLQGSRRQRPSTRAWR